MKNVRKVLMAALAVALVGGVAVLPQTAGFIDTAVEVHAAVSYTFENNVLTFTGTGEIPRNVDYTITESAKEIVFEEGITSLGEGLDYYPSVEKITFKGVPNTMGYAPFSRCPSLKEIVFEVYTPIEFTYENIEFCDHLNNVTVSVPAGSSFNGRTLTDDYINNDISWGYSSIRLVHPDNRGTNVSYTVAPAYTVVIPESVTLADTAVTAAIRIYGATENDNVMVGEGSKVNVALTESTNDFKVVNVAGDPIAYTVNGKNTTADLEQVASCVAGEKNTTDITFTKTGTASYAGSYTDTLTFTVSVAIQVTDVTLDKTSFSMTKDFEDTLTATVLPNEATFKTVKWTSSDENVATVDANGKVTGIGGGTAVITGTADGVSAECTVTVLTQRDYSVEYEGKTATFRCEAGQTWGEVIEGSDFVNDNNEITLFDGGIKKGYLIDATAKCIAKADTLIDLTHEFSYMAIPTLADQAVAATNHSSTFLSTGIVSQTAGYIGQPMTFEEAKALSQYFEIINGKKTVVPYGATVRTEHPSWSRITCVKDGASNDSYYMDAPISAITENTYDFYYVPKN